MSSAETRLSQSTIDTRVRAWRRSLDPGALWPETTSRDRVAAYRAIWHATRRILAGERASLDGTGSPAFAAIGVAGFLSGMGPLLGLWIEQGLLRADTAIAGELERHLSHGRRRHALMLQRFRETGASLRRHGVEPVVLKGMHTARVYFDDPGARPIGDIDLLVRPHEFPAAAAAMQESGLVVVVTHSRPERESWGPSHDMRIHSIHLSHADNPWGIDLHQTLSRSYFPGFTAGLGHPGPEATTRLSIDGMDITVLAHPALAAFLALHASSDLPEIQLIRIVELVLVLRRDFGTDADRWAALRILLAETNSRRLAYPALEMAEALAPGVVDPRVLDELKRDATPRMRRETGDAVTALPYHTSHRSIEARMVWAKGWRQVGRNALGWLVPMGGALSMRGRFRVIRHRARMLLTGRMAWRSRPPTDTSRVQGRGDESRSE